MRNGLLFFLGLFVALLLSWAGLVLGPHATRNREAAKRPVRPVVVDRR